MAHKQNKKTAKKFQDELDIMLDGLNMENYADNLNDDGDDSDRLIPEKHFVKDLPKGNPVDLDQLLMGADMERSGPKIVNINIKAEKKSTNIDALLDSVSESEDHSEELKSAVRSIAANKAHIPDIFDELDKTDDFEAFDEYGEIEGFAADIHSLSKEESKLSKPVKADSLVDLEQNFGAAFNTAQDEFENYEISNEAADQSIAAENAEPTDTLSEVQNKLDEYLKLAAEKATNKGAIQVQEPPIVSASSETESATTNSSTADYEIVVGELEDASDDPENLFLESVMLSNATPESAQVDDHSKAADLNDSVNETSVQSASTQILDRIELPEEEHKLSAIAAAADSLAEQPVLQEEFSNSDGIDDSNAGSETPVVAKIPEPVMVETESTINTDFMEQINALWTAHNLIKQEMVDFTQLKSNIDKLDKLVQVESKERKELKKSLDLSDKGTKKIPGIVYVAAGISALSLLIAGGLFAYGMSLNADVKDLKAHIAALEGDLSLVNQGSLGGSGSEDFAQAMEKQAESLGKSEQAIRVIAANGNEQPTSPKTASPNSGLWVANLMSFKQDWYANRKLAEFAKQGIKAEVAPVDVKGETWYILRSSGFTTQDQAVQYAEKAKKALSLTSILVTQND